MSDEQWEELQEKFYTKQPITREREEWDRLFSKEALEKHERQREEKKKEEKTRKKKARMKIRAQQRREDKSQTKLTAFFAKKTNDDGFPLKHCKYHPDFKRHIYVPPGYGRTPQSTSAKDPSEKKGVFCEFCCHCLLSPCVAERFFDEAWDLSSNICKESKRTLRNFVIREQLTVFLQKKHDKLFKKRYSKKRPVLACIRRCVERDIPVYGKDDSDASSVSSKETASEESEPEMEYEE